MFTQWSMLTYYLETQNDIFVVMKIEEKKIQACENMIVATKK